MLLPAHKNNPYLGNAIESILAQSHSNFELLILDNSQNGISDYISTRDSRVRIIELPAYFGLSETLNFGIGISRGTYIARMDYDDSSVNNRIEMQVKFLEAHPDVGILGGFIRYLGEQYDPKAKVGTTGTRPTSISDMKRYLLNKNPLFHPTVMFRASSIKEMEELYRKKYDSCEDLDLWSRAIFKMKIANLPEVLLEYRLHEDQYSRKARNSTEYLANKIRTIYAIRLFIVDNINRTESFKCAIKGLSKLPKLLYLRSAQVKFDKFMS